MRWLIDYIRSCFCKHEWKLLIHDYWDDTEYSVVCHRWIYECEKCKHTKKVMVYK